MCHFLLFLPLIALPAFWLLPLPIAVSLYVLALAIPIWMWVLAVRMQRRPAMTGAEAMIGESGRVQRTEGRAATLLIHGELWSAEGEGEPLAVGDTALVCGIDGLRLRARRKP